MRKLNYPKRLSLLPLGEVGIPFKFLQEADSCVVSTARLLRHLHMLPPESKDIWSDVLKTRKEMADANAAFRLAAVLEMWDDDDKFLIAYRTHKAVVDFVWLLQELHSGGWSYFYFHRRQLRELMLLLVDSVVEDAKRERQLKMEECIAGAAQSIDACLSCIECLRKDYWNIPAAAHIFPNLHDNILTHHTTFYGYARVLDKLKIVLQAKSIEECRAALAEMPAATQPMYEVVHSKDI